MNLCLGKIVFALWHRHTIFGTWVYHHETTCCVHSWPLYDLDIWPIYKWGGILSELYSLFLSCLIWRLLTIFGTWVYYQDRMGQVHSWSRYDVELWPQGQIYRFLAWFRALPVTNLFHHMHETTFVLWTLSIWWFNMNCSIQLSIF